MNAENADSDQFLRQTYLKIRVCPRFSASKNQSVRVSEQMSINERRKYLHKMRIRYWQVKTKAERKVLLDEMQAVTSLHRKSLIRLIKGELARKTRRQQRGKTYGAEVKATLEKIAHSVSTGSTTIWIIPAQSVYNRIGYATLHHSLQSHQIITCNLTTTLFIYRQSRPRHFGRLVRAQI